MKLAGSIITLCMVVSSWSPVAGQPLSTLADERGLPYAIRHYAPQEYRQQPINWSVVQDLRGIIYVANIDGILEFDGDNWRTIRTVTNTTVRSLAVSREGIVYVGVQGDFGYLTPDSTGVLHYASLIDEVEKEHRGFTDVWATRATSRAVFFLTRERLFRWDGQEMKVWESSGLFHTAFVVRDRFYVRELGRGLLEVVNDSLQQVPLGERFDSTSVFVMEPHPDGRILIGTRKDGFLLYDRRSLEPFPTAVDSFLRNYSLYNGCILDDGTYALATKGGGVVIIDHQGSLVQVLNKEAGLPDGMVNYVFQDVQGGLWLALYNSGLVWVDTQASLSVYDDRLGLEGIIHRMIRYQDTLYVATGSGLYHLNQEPLRATDDERQRSIFVPVRNVPLPLSLHVSDQGFFITTQGGIYLRRNGKSIRITSQIAFAIQESQYFSGRVYVGLKDGLGFLHRTAEGWQLHRMPGFHAEVQSIVEDIDGTLWLGTAQSGVWRVHPQEESDGKPQITYFGPEDGLPDTYIGLDHIKDEVAFLSKEGIYRFDAEAEQNTLHNAFRPDTSLGRQEGLQAFDEDGSGNLWMVYPDRVDIIRPQEDGVGHRLSPEVLRLPKDKVAKRQIYLEENGLAWISDGDRLIRYDPSVPTQESMMFPVMVRSVQVLGSGKVVFGGTTPAAYAATDPESRVETVELPFENNDLYFSYATPTYGAVLENEYQYYLEGTEAGWSEWTPSTQKTYTNLGPGTYRFYVRARNYRGDVSAETVYAFIVLPPWYRTWWAYGFYVVALAVVALGYRRYREILEENKRAQEQARELALERLANERLQQANESLKQVNRLKDELLANTSHELRTPLTAILGFASILKEELSEQHHEFVDIIEANGERLLGTVNSLLDLAKIRAGMMDMRLEKVDVLEEATRITHMLRPLALQKNLNLEVCPADAHVYAYVDPRYLHQILQNIVGNAIKFTNQGSVTVMADVTEHGRVCVAVHDTGVGISEDFLPHVFDDFKQESSGLSRTHEGTGLGLSIAARFAELMDGEITVKSKKGEGSIFAVFLPAYKTYAGDRAAA